METFPRWRTLRVPPFDGSGTWVYSTLGTWEATRDGDPPEYFLFSPRETPYHIETLAALTLRIATRGRAFGIGEVIDLGRPWIQGSQPAKFLVSRPYPFGPEFEWCPGGTGDRIHFLWLVPLYDAEADFVVENGSDAFDDLAEESGVEFANPGRKCLVCECPP